MASFYAIEGHAFAGKTTLIHHLVETFGLHQVGEYDSFVSNTNEYPPHPHKTAEIAKLDVDFFVDLDLRREKCLREFSTSETPTVMDRTFVSLILFQKYTKYLNRKNEYNSYEYAKERYYELIVSGRLSVPHLMVYLAPKDMEVYNSRLTRKISSDTLRSTDAYIFFNQQYSTIFEAYKKAGRLMLLSSNNTKENLRENARSINNIKVSPLTTTEQNDLVEEIFKII